MSWLTELFRERRDKTSANTARERLKLVVVADRMHERGARRFLPERQRDILKAIRRYVQVPDSAVAIDVSRDDTMEALELTITVPESAPPAKKPPAKKARR